MRDVRTVADGFSYLEAPRWHDGRLWLSDFYTHQVVALDPSTGDHQVIVEVDAQPSGLGWLPDGSLLVVSMKDHRILRLDDGELVEHADLSGQATGHVNDMVVDGDGRAWVGNFGFDLMGGGEIAPAALVRVDPDGTTTVVAEDMLFPNGSVITPDGSRLIVAETVGQRLTAFDLDADGGATNRRTWAKLGEEPTTTSVPDALATSTFLPDGICLDAEGLIWAADALSGRVARIAEGGDIVEQVEVGSGAFACMLGGVDNRTLFICSAPSFAEHERIDTREAVLLAVEVDVPHAGRP